VFLTLGDLYPRWLGVARELPSLWLSLGKFVLSSSVWGLIVENRIDLGGCSERFRVERNPILYGHLNGDIGILWCLTSGTNLVSCVLKSLYIQSSCSCSCLARVSYVYISLSFIYLFLAYALLPFHCSYLY
jgi:hypothetical protein